MAISRLLVSQPERYYNGSGRCDVRHAKAGKASAAVPAKAEPDDTRNALGRRQRRLRPRLCGSAVDPPSAALGAGIQRGDMDTCYYCGEKIVFRWVDGALRRIHVNGGWCTGGLGGESGYARSCFDTVTSYLDPNARCPVCGASVFFYRSPHNGRVFFDDVGWPWPKHPCTDTYEGRDDQIRRPVNSRLRFSFKNREGNALEVYLVKRIIERADHLRIRLKNVKRGPDIRMAIRRAELAKQCIEIADIREAPSLVLPRESGQGGETEVSFMCGRLQSVVVLAAKVRVNSEGR